ncbi:hypothetical protein MVEG_00180 [Podila verticillata NRRL 6337]|nr:hypothetical protein MVEG_00180 [Podila verticillata NRRL 6337]
MEVCCHNRRVISQAKYDFSRSTSECAFQPIDVIERSRDHSKVSPSRAVAQDGGQVWVFHITQPRRTAIHGKFDHELRAPQGDKLLCTCTVTPEEFKATLTSVNTSEIFKRFSALCIVINGMIEGVSQIGRDAQTATAIILPSTVTDGKYYRFSLLLQARFQKELLPTGRTFSIPRTARSSTITPPSLLPTKASLSPVLSSEDTDAGESHILETPSLLLIANKSLPVKRKGRNEAETSHPVAPLPHLLLSVTHSPIESEEDTKVGTTHTVASPPPMITRNSLVQDRGNTEAGSNGTVATPKTLGMVRDSPVQHKEEQTKARMTNAERTQSLLMALMANCSPFRSKDEETEPEPNRRVAPSIPSLPSHPPLTNRYSQVRSNTAFEDGTRAVSTTSAHSAAHFTGSVTDPPSGQSAALYIKSSSAPQPPPLPAVTVHFYHYDSCSNARNAVEASSEDLQPYCRIMEMVHKTYDFRRAMSPLYSCCSPLRSGEERPAILLDMSFLEWEPLKIAIEYAHSKELTLGDVADRGEGVEMAYLDQVLEVMEVAGRLEMEDLVAACSAICMEH